MKCWKDCYVVDHYIPINGDKCDEDCQFYVEDSTSGEPVMWCQKKCTGQTPYQLAEYKNKTVGPVKCASDCSELNGTYQFY